MDRDNHFTHITARAVNLMEEYEGNRVISEPIRLWTLGYAGQTRNTYPRVTRSCERMVVTFLLHPPVRPNVSIFRHLSLYGIRPTDVSCYTVVPGLFSDYQLVPHLAMCPFFFSLV